MTVAKTAPEPDHGEPTRSAGDYLKAGIPLTTLAVAVLMGFLLGASGAILALAAGALVGVIATFWASIRTLFGETPLSGADAYALGAPRAEEEQKQAVLRALKDLEFERSVGKISEEDYQALVTKYRAEAKRLLRLLDADAQPRRDQVEALVEKRLRRAGLLNEAAGEEAEAGASEAEEEAGADVDAERAEAGGAKAVDREEAVVARTLNPEPKATALEAPQRKKKRGGKKGAAGEKQAVKREEPEKAAAAARVCGACGTSNDEDAVFCKKCGARQGPPPAEARGDAAGGGDTGSNEAGA